MKGFPRLVASALDLEDRPVRAVNQKVMARISVYTDAFTSILLLTLTDCFYLCGSLSRHLVSLSDCSQPS